MQNKKAEDELTFLNEMTLCFFSSFDNDQVQRKFETVNTGEM